jgi:hypothetical protein
MGLALPLGALGRVFQDDSLIGQAVADLVRQRELFRLSQLAPGVQQQLYEWLGRQ